jgi:hypothetical protein
MRALTRTQRGSGAALWGLIVLVLSPCLACDGSLTEPANWPEGTAMVLDGEPIPASAIDDHIDAMLDIQPAFGETQRRRMVLLHYTLPLFYARIHGGEAREAALAEAEGWLASLDAGNNVESEWKRHTGNWNELGLDLWLAVRELEPGERIGVVELPGHFVVARMEGRDGSDNRAHERMQVLVEPFYFVEQPETLIQDYLEGTLEIVDPAWKEVVPGIVEYEMTEKELERS